AILLARARLARRGIHDPSPGELRAALSGGRAPKADGEIWTGVIPSRERGHTWAEIVRGLGERPAQFEEVLRAWRMELASGALAGKQGAPSSAEPVRITETGITTGRGKAIPTFTPPPEGQKGIGEGILSGSGNILGVPGRKPVPPPESKPQGR
ncbi:MAG: hypothetical protein AABZ64_13225, partial [Nitrospinota bacterium]